MNQTKITMTKTNKRKVEERVLELVHACENKKNKIDRTRDIYEIQNLLREERELEEKLQKEEEMFKSIKVVDENEIDESRINIGDTVDLLITDSKGRERDRRVTLVATLVENPGQEVSINAPLGEAIYGEPVGTGAFFTVNENNFTVFIKEKVKEEAKTFAKNPKK